MSPLFNIHSHQAGKAHETTIINIHQNFRRPLAQGYFSAGIHPRYIEPENLDIQLADLAVLLQHPSVVALGECGLDRLCKSDWPLQHEVFAQQIVLANQCNKPLILHCVRAFEEVQKLCKDNHCQVPVVFHGFSKASVSLAHSLTSSGAFLSFGKALFQEAVADVFKQVPADRFFLETDDSKLPLRSVYERAAVVKNVSVNELSRMVEANKNLIFDGLIDS